MLVSWQQDGVTVSVQFLCGGRGQDPSHGEKSHMFGFRYMVGDRICLDVAEGFRHLVGNQNCLDVAADGFRYMVGDHNCERNTIATKCKHFGFFVRNATPPPSPYRRAKTNNEHLI